MEIFVWVVSNVVFPMQCINHFYEVNEWYTMPFYILICYCIFGWYTGIQYFMGGSHLTFDAGDSDVKEAPTTHKCKEVWVCTIIVGVSRVCDMWRSVEDIFFQCGCHHEVVGAY